MRDRVRALSRAAWACGAATWLLAGALAGGCQEHAGSAAAARPAAGEHALRVVLVSELEGVLEPCGCGGRPAGGVDRLVAAIDALRADGRPTLVVGVGRQEASEPPTPHEAERQARVWRADAVREVLRRVRLDATSSASGSDASARLLPGSVPVGLVSASPSGDRPLDRAQLAAEVAALRDRGARAVLLAIDAGQDAQPTVAELQGVGADVVVRTGVGSDRAASAALGAHGRLVTPARQGAALTSLELRLSRSSRPAVQVIDRALDAAAPADREVRAMLTRLFARIEALHAKEAALPIEPSAASLDHTGSEACAACHTAAYYDWRRSPHGRALATLVARGRQHDFECVGCHVTGWDEGAPTLRGLDRRAGVGCESCHGPGSAHVQNPRPPHRGIALEVPEARCRACHDSQHSPAFDYARFVARVLTPAHGARRAADGAATAR